jgi:hypothetical protein
MSMIALVFSLAISFLPAIVPPGVTSNLVYVLGGKVSRAV